jgi:hypothetical protein
MADQIHEIVSADGNRRVEFYLHGDGLCSWNELALYHSVPGDYGHPYDWWAPTLSSGRYDTLARAQADAAADLPWLREL